MAEEKKKEIKVDPVEAFIARKLKIINEMKSPAKAKKAAERVLRNRKVGK